MWFGKAGDTFHIVSTKPIKQFTHLVKYTEMALLAEEEEEGRNMLI